ncbi:hypothetical protein [uncultured Tateyamaria sp.]|uniref:hypothetical protein n=1 Tax=uncultured Tateyamaria sp. TaxID=455651 RepID=UPI00260340CA|nr:hypothetical protein [uncultured Tateyamaria sp.]
MKRFLSSAALCLVAAPVFAVDVPAAMTGFAQDQMRNVARNAAIIDAIIRQNAQTAALSEAEIIELDNTWRSEVDSGERTMINSKLNNPVSVFLSALVDRSDGVITEVFVMDARGLNVGQSSVTSDFWQGDEAKFTETYLKGPDAMHISEVELDESTNAYQGQVSITITAPGSSEPIGAVTFGIDATSFF